MKDRNLTTRQQLTMMKKHCLAKRIVWLCIGLFGSICINVGLGAVVLSEKQMRHQTECTYKSTVELDSFKQKQLHEDRLRYYGIPTQKEQP